MLRLLNDSERELSSGVGANTLRSRDGSPSSSDSSKGSCAPIPQSKANTRRPCQFQVPEYLSKFISEEEDRIAQQCDRDLSYFFNSRPDIDHESAELGRCKARNDAPTGSSSKPDPMGFADDALIPTPLDVVPWSDPPADTFSPTTVRDEHILPGGSGRTYRSPVLPLRSQWVSRLDDCDFAVARDTTSECASPLQSSAQAPSQVPTQFVQMPAVELCGAPRRLMNIEVPCADRLADRPGAAHIFDPLPPASEWNGDGVISPVRRNPLTAEPYHQRPRTPAVPYKYSIIKEPAIELIPQRRAEDLLWEHPPVFVPDQQLRWIAGKGPSAMREELSDKLSGDHKHGVVSSQPKQADAGTENVRPAPYTIFVHGCTHGCPIDAWYGPAVTLVTLHDEAPNGSTVFPQTPYEPPRPAYHGENQHEVPVAPDGDERISQRVVEGRRAGEGKRARGERGVGAASVGGSHGRRRKGWVPSAGLTARVPLSPRFTSQSASRCQRRSHSGCSRADVCRGRAGASVPSAAARAVPPAMQREFFPFTGYTRDQDAELRPLAAKGGRRSPDVFGGHRTPEALLRPLTPAPDVVDRFF